MSDITFSVTGLRSSIVDWIRVKGMKVELGNQYHGVGGPISSSASQPIQDEDQLFVCFQSISD